jgi:hypothetical protein
LEEMRLLNKKRRAVAPLAVGSTGQYGKTKKKAGSGSHILLLSSGKAGEARGAAGETAGRSPVAVGETAGRNAVGRVWAAINVPRGY